MATKKATKKAPAKKVAEKAPTKKVVKKATVKPKAKKCEDIPLKNCILLWLCLTALVLVFIYAFCYLIPQAKALDTALHAPSVKHMPAPEVVEMVETEEIEKVAE